jgi:4-amino-4-deoxychorismate lyase
VNAPLQCWVDGAASTSVPIDDRGLAYGDGLFETLLLRRGVARFLELHLERLALGCERLGIRFDAMAALRREISHALDAAPSLAILKIMVTRGSATRRGYASDAAQCPRRLMALWAAEPLSAQTREGVDLEFSSLVLGEQPALAGIKHLNRLEQVLAASAPRAPGVFDVLLGNAAGDVVCGSMTNVFAVTAGRLVTPRVDRAGVAGVLRAVVRRECAALGLVCEERPLSAGQLLASDEAFVTNARIGVVPVRRVGEHRFTMNRVAQVIQAHVEALDA